MKRMVYVAVIASALGLGSTANAQQLNKISVGEVAPIAAAWPLFVAQEKQLFAKHGLDATVTYAGSAANAVQQVVAGAYDISDGTFDSAMRAAAHGAAISLLGTPVVRYPYSIMVQADVKSAADLKGKTIILPFQKDITTTIWNRWLKEHGIDPKSVDQVYDGATPNRFAALSSKAVQAAFLGSPFEFKAEAAGFKKLFDFGEYAMGFPFTAVIARKDWLKTHSDLAKRYLAALSDAVDFLYDPANRDESIAILAKATKQDKDIAGLTYDYYVKTLKAFSRNLVPPVDAVKIEAGALTEMGDLKSPSEIPADFVDTSLLPK